jgi:hypothetical protein
MILPPSKFLLLLLFFLVLCFVCGVNDLQYFIFSKRRVKLVVDHVSTT